LFSINAAGTITTAPELMAATSTAIVMDWSSTPPQVNYQIGTAATSITIINATTSAENGSRKVVWVCNPPAASAGALTWHGPQWIGSAPTQTTTQGQCDIYSYDITAATSSPFAPTYVMAGSQGAGLQ
jgi:hypothetical protein